LYYKSVSRKQWLPNARKKLRVLYTTVLIYRTAVTMKNVS